MGLKTTQTEKFSHNKKTETKNLAKNPEENNGIASNHNFEDESEFRDWFADWLKGRKLYRAGYKNETKETKKWDKKEAAQITEVETETSTTGGQADIAVHHDFLNLSWSHILASPFIIECKKKKFREAAAQSIRYKTESSKKYLEKGKYKVVKTSIATPQSLSTAEIAKRWEGAEKPLYPNKEAKRIYWKIGVGVVQSNQPDKVILSFNEGDMVKIE